MSSDKAVEYPAFVGEWHRRAVELGYDGVSELIAFALPCIVNSGGDERAAATPPPNPEGRAGIHDGYGRDAALSRDEWFASDYGRQATDGSAKGKYLHNRLEAAYLAGYQSGHFRAVKRLTAAPQGDGGVDEFEIWQDESLAAGASGPQEVAAREALHYASLYAQDGDIEVYAVTRRKVSMEELAALASSGSQP